MKMTGAKIITTLLEKHGIKIVAGIPGGSILPLYDELSKSSIKHILVRQEQAAGFIAQGMARTTGKPAVCMATSGPGAMNLLTAIADARCDSIPIIAITGQVNTSLIGTDAFQEADTFGLSFPISKHSIAVKDAKELIYAIPKAFKIAMEGRPGPVLIDVPRDVQLQEVEIEDVFEGMKKNENQKVRFESSKQEIEQKMNEIISLLSNAQKPVLYIGGGCNSPEGQKCIRQFKDLYRLPVVTSLMALGVVPFYDRDNAGMVGMHGSYAANFAMYESDLVFALGVRFDDRATGVVQKFCPLAKIIHIDIDAAEINKILSASVSIVSKVEEVLPAVTKALKENFTKQEIPFKKEREIWAETIFKTKEKNFSFECGAPKIEEKRQGFSDSINPRSFLSQIPSLAKEVGVSESDMILTTDVGQHQMFTAQYYPFTEARTFLTSASLGTMGFGLPAAIGAALANDKKRIVCISGDGSILMNIQELATLSENNLAVTVILFVNKTLGMVYQQQKFLFQKNYSASTFSLNPDFLKIAEGFGIEGTDANTDKDWYKKAFDSKRKNKPYFVTVQIDPEENVLPFVPGGKANVESIR
ncbi:biosynthetic-type acetolactate synthase large subunit [Treponema pectinovorum]|uniref:biosynthetic-type acetolactate synthase large subunit n=1 Tax=Treponema pectinovorum TaxID=164 RepID=UPI0011F2EA65|nr:biosynthetic-type acetolactate synthase large subunit [Treponema pectinovorum]